MFDKKTLRNIDWPLLSFLGLILAYGLLILSSASANLPVNYTAKQAFYIGVGTVVMAVFTFVNYTSYRKYWAYIYGFSLALLAAVLVAGIGAEEVGSQSWFNVGGFNFQPSEFSKVAIILTFAHFLANRQGRLNTFWEMVPAFVFVGVPLLLILKQPDLGTALVYLAVMFAMMLVAGANWKIIVGLYGGALMAAVAWIWAHLKFGVWLPLKDYQVKRLTNFIDPSTDPLGSGYHIIQSKIAIGSGGILGKGLYQGSQIQYNFLPEHHTDFIFAVVGEELGFVGSVLLLALFLGFLLRGIYIAGKSKDFYGALVATGVVAMFTFHVLENAGMTMGVMPITGIPLPFVSYGGSSMLTNLAAVGLLLSISLRRQKILF